MATEFEPIRVLGLMSGTSIDGVDAAVLETDGEGAITFGPTSFEPYSKAERAVLRKVMGSWPGPGLEQAAELVLEAHKRAALGKDVHAVGFHGQTLAHDPDGARTHQLGCGATLAKMLGRDVIWDFRTADMTAGGQGAPLAPFYHHALARRAGLTQPVAFLNLGGVANVTWVNPQVARPEAPGALVAFDTGPANALLDDFLSARAGLAFDEDGRLAARGTANQSVLDELSDLTYLAKPAPKSLDRDSFAHVLTRLTGCTLEDGAATLTAITASCVGRAVDLMPVAPTKWFACGGGRHNLTMMAMIEDAIGADIKPVEALGFDGDMLEAQAFAWLAVRVMRGLPTSCPSTTGCTSPVSGGIISRA